MINSMRKENKTMPDEEGFLTDSEYRKLVVKYSQENAKLKAVVRSYIDWVEDNGLDSEMRMLDDFTQTHYYQMKELLK
ncbi:MAG: hypothetical protein ACE5HI_15625 [bacterium]